MASPNSHRSQRKPPSISTRKSGHEPFGTRDGSRAHLRSSPLDVRLPAYGVFVFESHHSETFHMETASWPFWKICLVAVGRGQVEIGDRRYRIGTNDLVILPAGQPHRFLDDPELPLTLVMICWNEAAEEQNRFIVSALEGVASSYAEPRNIPGRFHTGVVRECFRRMLREQEDGARGASALIHARFLQLIVQMQRMQSGLKADADSHGRDLEGVLHYVDENFDKPLQLQDLAQLCGLSERRLTTLFKQRTGTTVVAYLTAKRIDYAKERLKQTGHILYAAYEAGFTDPAYFYRVFKKATGMTPGRFLELVGGPGGG